MTGRHRSPPPALRTGWRWHTVAALAGLGILAPPVTLWAEAVAPDATAARSQVSTVTRAERTDAGPLLLPTVGAEGAWSPTEVTRTAVRPVTVTRTPVRTRRPASTVQAGTQPLGATATPPQQTVTPTTPEVTTAPPAELAAATTTSSATTTEEQPVTTPTEPSVTVDVTAEVSGP